MSELSADRPLDNPKLDRLGYATFAKNLAVGIDRMQAPDGIVLGLYGKWGLGKTTVLNFVEYELRGLNPNGFVVVRFNPWWFSGRSDLAFALIGQLQSSLSRVHALSKELRKHLTSLARVAGAVPIPQVSASARFATQLLEQQRDITELKATIAHELAKEKRRVLILVDDVDRLSRDEITQLFGVIKALIDFPKTIYLVAFDDDRVAEALKEQAGDDARAYLEKIIQVPFELPPPDPAAIRDLLVSRLHEIIQKVAEDLLDPQDWQSVLTGGLHRLVQTPRDVVRLTNALQVTYEAVRGEVNVVDFVVLESLRIFEPAVFRSIRQRPDMFGVATGLAAVFGMPDEERARAALFFLRKAAPAM